MRTFDASESSSEILAIVPAQRYASRKLEDVQVQPAKVKFALVRILRWFRSEAAAGTQQRWHIFKPSVLAFLCCFSVAARRVLPFET